MPGLCPLAQTTTFSKVLLSLKFSHSMQNLVFDIVLLIPSKLIFEIWATNTWMMASSTNHIIIYFISIFKISTFKIKIWGTFSLPYERKLSKKSFDTFSSRSGMPVTFAALSYSAIKSLLSIKLSFHFLTPAINCCRPTLILSK